MSPKRCILVGISERYRRQENGRGNFQHGDIRARVGADNFGFKFPLVFQRHGDIRRAIHHVVVGQDIAVGADDYAGAETVLLLRTGRLTLTLPLVAATPATEWISEKLSKRGIILKRIAATLCLHHLGSRNVNDLRQ